MKKMFVILAFGVVIFLAVTAAFPGMANAAQTGEDLFMQNCKVCHPDGGNVVNPKKTLHKKDREENNVKTAQDIVNKMRHPGPGMVTFDEKTIPNKEAKEIAEYVLKTFK